MTSASFTYVGHIYLLNLKCVKSKCPVISHAAALQSVFPQTELGTFMSLIKRDKERQLVELTQIVTGIRLFNKECGKGGEGIDDLPAILNEAVPATTQNVDSAIQRACSIAFRYTGECVVGGVG